MAAVSLLSMLHNVRQFVRQQTASFTRPRLILARPENHLLPNRISRSVDGARRFRRLPVCVYAYTAEVMTQAGLHEVARLRIERLACRTKHLINYGRDDCRFGMIGDTPLQFQTL